MIQTNKRGFTIIEVVLVLAIAGLIFLVVFLALPALQKGQRDTQRKNDLSRFMSQITNYSSNNQGNVPQTDPDINTPATGFKARYLTINGESFKDPSTGNDYTITVQGVVPNATPVGMNNGDIYYYINAGCNGESVVDRAGARNVAAAIKLERGSILCQQN